MGKKKEPRIEIVLRYQASNMLEEWDMFLCLHQVNKNEWCLDIRQHEVVEAGEFKDSRGRLLSRIKGYKVIRNDRGDVTIDNLLLNEDYFTYEFSKFDVKKFTDIFNPQAPEIFNKFFPLKHSDMIRKLMGSWAKKSPATK